MGSLIRAAATGAACLALAAVPAAAQQPTGVMADLLTDLKEAQDKIVGLAKAMPESGWTWRPGAGVRSTGEVVQHLAADNYLIPAVFGAAPPATTGIKAEDYKTVQAYETRKIDRAAAIAELEASFAHLRKTMMDTPASALGEKINAFGQSYTKQQMWVLATTHVHEHLGQLIAYARSNNVVPPWSRGN
ncbi:MAG TPA: DinB family protein [Gemmatimonadales bacterium]